MPDFSAGIKVYDGDRPAVANNVESGGYRGIYTAPKDGFFYVGVTEIQSRKKDAWVKINDIPLLVGHTDSNDAGWDTFVHLYPCKKGDTITRYLNGNIALLYFFPIK